MSRFKSKIWGVPVWIWIHWILFALEKFEFQIWCANKIQIKYWKISHKHKTNKIFSLFTCANITAFGETISIHIMTNENDKMPNIMSINVKQLTMEWIEYSAFKMIRCSRPDSKNKMDRWFYIWISIMFTWNDNDKSLSRCKTQIFVHLSSFPPLLSLTSNLLFTKNHDKSLNQMVLYFKILFLSPCAPTAKPCNNFIKYTWYAGWP